SDLCSLENPNSFPGSDRAYPMLATTKCNVESTPKAAVIPSSAISQEPLTKVRHDNNNNNNNNNDQDLKLLLSPDCFLANTLLPTDSSAFFLSESDDTKLSPESETFYLANNEHLQLRMCYYVQNHLCIYLIYVRKFIFFVFFFFFLFIYLKKHSSEFFFFFKRIKKKIKK
ncbi:hypothetical protein RFI_37328, partial [Reticulomyxa filosa]